MYEVTMKSSTDSGDHMCKMPDFDTEPVHRRKVKVSQHKSYIPS